MFGTTSAQELLLNVSKSIGSDSGRMRETVMGWDGRDHRGRAFVSVPFAWHGDDRLSALDRLAQARIVTELRSMYADLVEQPLPDRIVELLAALDRRDDRMMRSEEQSS